jgi:hypothetical protein
MLGQITADAPAELKLPDPPKKDFTRLLNDPSEGAAAVVSGAALPPVRLQLEHPATVAATAAALANGGQFRRRAFQAPTRRDGSRGTASAASAAGGVQRDTSVMRKTLSPVSVKKRAVDRSLD